MALLVFVVLLLSYLVEGQPGIILFFLLLIAFVPFYLQNFLCLFILKANRVKPFEYEGVFQTLQNNAYWSQMQMPYIYSFDSKRDIILVLKDMRGKVIVVSSGILENNSEKKLKEYFKSAFLFSTSLSVISTYFLCFRLLFIKFLNKVSFFVNDSNLLILNSLYVIFWPSVSTFLKFFVSENKITVEPSVQYVKRSKKEKRYWITNLDYAKESSHILRSLIQNSILFKIRLEDK
ncbi:MAG: hypothetical protein N4A33_08715 [Bacteriovoracaceae bacterium]|jgi:hypothetical protein|nr:hypothetical protein [Bacteriovoracaceae bacterium]